MKDLSSFLVLIAILIFIVLIALYIFVLRITPEEVPQFIKAWVVTQVSGDPVASNEPKVVSKDRRVKLYAVIAGRKKDSEEITYFTNALQLRLDGKEISAKQIERWQKKWGNVKIIWSKIEPMMGSFTNATHPQNTKVLFRDIYCDEWPSIWESKADVNLSKPETPPGVKEPEKSEFEEFQQGLGTMRYTIFAVLYWGENRVNPIRKAKSPGVEAADELGIKNEVTRLSIKEDNSLLGAMRALHNIPYVEYSEPQEKRIYRIQNLIGFDSIGAVMAALILMGKKDLGNYDLESLQRLSNILHEDVYLSQEGFYYPAGKPNQKIRFASNGVKTGDFILSGSHIGAIVRDIGHEGLPNGWLDYADSVLHCYNAPLEEEYLSQAFLGNFAILRLKE